MASGHQTHNEINFFHALRSEQYLVLCLLSQLALELLELLGGVAAESLVGFFQSTDL